MKKIIITCLITVAMLTMLVSASGYKTEQNEKVAELEDRVEYLEARVEVLANYLQQSELEKAKEEMHKELEKDSEKVEDNQEEVKNTEEESIKYFEIVGDNAEYAIDFDNCTISQLYYRTENLTEINGISKANLVKLEKLIRHIEENKSDKDLFLAMLDEYFAIDELAHKKLYGLEHIDKNECLETYISETMFKIDWRMQCEM